MSDGQIYDAFQQAIDNLESTANNVAIALQGQTQREWRIPPNWDTAPTDIPNLGTGFVRDDINGGYQNFFDSSSATAGDCVSAKLQCDHLALQERAFRARHMTHIRASIHASARRSGQARSGGSFDRILNQATDVMLDAPTASGG